MKIKYEVNTQGCLKAIYVMITGFFLALLLFIETAQAEDFRDQQDRLREESYRQQDYQREINRQRDHQELRQTQDNQALKYQEQNLEMKQAKKRLQQPAQPYEPEIIMHDRGQKQLNQQDEQLNQKHDLQLPKVNMDRLLEGE